VDVGAGDGGYVLHRARTEPTTFAMAIDASPDALSSGAWRAKRARLRNAAFLVQGVEGLPPELSGIADEVTVHFPWGSLLRGLLDGSSGVVGPMARLMKEHGELRVLISGIDRDRIGTVDPALVIARRDAYREVGLRLVTAQWATDQLVAESRSGWAKRLGVGRARRAVIARYRRDGT
jgi:16S rRNA (adenine(1408)-N(1))-methyltransferase